MTTSEINQLAKSNSVIKDAWKKFKKARISYRAIVYVYEMAHFVKPIHEAYIEYIDINGYKRKFQYYEEVE